MNSHHFEKSTLQTLNKNPKGRNRFGLAFNTFLASRQVVVTTKIWTTCLHFFCRWRYFLWGHVANSKSWSTNLQSKNLGILGFWNAQTSRFPHCFWGEKNTCLSIPTLPTARKEMSTLYPVTWWDWRRNETSTCRCFVVTHLLGFIQRWHVKYIYCPAVSVETQMDHKDRSNCKSSQLNSW